MFEEDIFKEAKYCVACNKFYITNQCPFCTPKNATTSTPPASDAPPTHSGSREEVKSNNNVHPPVSAKAPPYERNKPGLEAKVEEMRSEIERLTRENSEKREQIAKNKELELKFNILADKFERLSNKEKEHKEQDTQKQTKKPWFGRDHSKTNKVKANDVHPSTLDKEKHSETELLKERIKGLSDELERLQQKNEEKDRQVIESVAEASKLNGIAGQQRDELERLRFDIQERDSVIMQISLTLSSAISQALAQKSQEKLQQLTASGSAQRFPPSEVRGQTVKQNMSSRKTLYIILGGLNVAIIGYFVGHLGYSFLYKNGTISSIIEFFANLF